MVDYSRADVRFMQPGEEEGLLEHLDATFNGWPNFELSVPPIEHLRWKLSSDSSVSSCNVIAEAGSRIVGALLFVGQRVQTEAGELLAAHGVDWSVRPEYQGHGLMAAMRTLALERLKERADFNPVQSGNAAVYALHQREGYRHMGNPPQRLALTLSAMPARSDERFSIATAHEFDERIDALWAAAAPAFQYIGFRDQRWLNWRYCDRRSGPFTVRLAERNAELLGYSVSSNRRKTGYIVDLLTLPDRVDVAETLIHDALAAFKREGCVTAECWWPARHPYRMAFDASGFIPRSRQERMIHKAMRVPEDQLSFLEDRNAAVHFTLGDSDLL